MKLEIFLLKKSIFELDEYIIFSIKVLKKKNKIQK